MEGSNISLPGFEFVDIEIIDHQKLNASDGETKWNCDKCSLFFLTNNKLIEHKKKHVTEDHVNCKYCKKILNKTIDDKECYSNRKCETCEYRCSKCPKRFLRNSSLVNHEKNHLILTNKKKTSKKPISRGVKLIVSKTKTAKSNKIKEIRKKSLEQKIRIFRTGKKLKVTKKINPESSDPLECADADKDVPQKVKSLKKSVVEEEPEVINTPQKLATKKSIVKEEPEVISTPQKLAPTKPVVKEEPGLVNAPSTSTSVPFYSPNQYKPFACHLCSDTFFSQNELLEHIKSHGVDEGFKCKHCSESFDDIYQMQYHLAICPLDKDDVLNTAIKAIPSKLILNNTNGTRKRGRPRKTSLDSIKVESVEGENSTETSLNTSRRSERKKSEITILDSIKVENENVIETSLNTSRRRGKKKSETSILDLIKVESSDDENNTITTPNTSRRKKNKSDISKEDLNNSTSTPSSKQRKRRSINKYSVVEDKDNGNMLTSPTASFNNINNEDENKRKEHTCPFPKCGIKFSREKALLCHMRNHNDDFDETLKCHKCDVPFDDVQSLRSHIDMCKEMREEKDDDSEEYSPEEKSYSPDKAVFVNKRRPFHCRECGKSYVSQERLDRHHCQQKIPTLNNPLSMNFPCRLCGKELTTQSSLKNHFNIFHPNNLQFQCPTCHVEYDDLTEVNDHILTHVTPLYECSACLIKLRTISELNIHYAKCRPGADPLVCVICNKKLSDMNALGKHVKSHTGLRPYPCPICSMTFTLKATQVVHIRRHTNHRPFKCKYCTKSFFISGDLLKHHRLHTGERPYKCEQCGYRFTLKECLNSHMKRHFNISPYKCGKCSKTFKTSTLLRYHMSVHVGVRSYPCPLCSKSYYQMGSLKTHIKKQHIPQSKLNALNICEICGIVKNNGIQLAKHMTTHSTNFSRQSRNINNAVPSNRGGRSSRWINSRAKRRRVLGEAEQELHDETNVDDLQNGDYKTQSKHNSRNSHQNNKRIGKNKRNARRNTRGTTKQNTRKLHSKDIEDEDSANESKDLEETIVSPEIHSDENGYNEEDIDTSEIIQEKVTEDVMEVESIKEKVMGVQEVTVFEPAVKTELRCFICTKTFVAHDELLNHVSIHI